jgi:hypothetical protein
VIFQMRPLPMRNGSDRLFMPQTGYRPAIDDLEDRSPLAFTAAKLMRFGYRWVRSPTSAARVPVHLRSTLSG